MSVLRTTSVEVSGERRSVIDNLIAGGKRLSLLSEIHLARYLKAGSEFRAGQSGAIELRTDREQAISAASPSAQFRRRGGG